jgi:MYXO-CTERM domain-containing protein
MRCSEPCDPAASQCPDGFSCLSAGDTGACWPGASVIQTPDGGDGGGCGCTVGGTGRRVPVLGFFLGVLVLVGLGRRRRRG